MPITDRYSYQTAKGAVAFIKLRFDPKRFSYRWPNGAEARADQLPPLLYRLPELIAANPDETVWIVEGEKDVERLYGLGLVATCNYDGGGKGKWLRSYGRYLRGRNVVIIPDNDATGSFHAEDIATKLSGVSKTIRLLDLPGLPRKGDVSDWLDRGGTVTTLQQLATKLPEWRQRIELQPLDELAWVYHMRTRIQEVLRADLSPQEKLLLIVLSAGIAKPKPTQQTIAAAVNLSAGRIKKLLAGLRQRGIVSVRKQGRDNLYDCRVSRP